MEQKKGRPYLTGAELTRFFAAVDAHPGKTPSQRRKKKRDQLFFRLCFVLGLRKSEAINIRISDVDLDEHTIRIPRLKRKDKKRIRTYDLDDDIMRRLREYLKLREAVRGATFNEFLFITPQSRASGHIGVDMVTKDFKTYARKAGLPAYFAPHSLRHSCAIALAMRGASSIVIKNRLGHRSWQSADDYIELAGEEAKQMEALTNKMLEI